MIEYLNKIEKNYYYYLADGQPVEAKTLQEWIEKFEQESRRFLLDEVYDVFCGNPYRISTVFLGINHNFDKDGDPILWETMTFNDDSLDDLCCSRYYDKDEAEEGHYNMVDFFKPKEYKLEITTNADKKHASYRFKRTVYAKNVDDAFKIIRSEAIPFGMKMIVVVEIDGVLQNIKDAHSEL